MWHLFADKRYRNERLLLVFGVPVGLLALIGVIFLLVSQESSLQKPVSILTADQIEPTEEAAPEAKRASIEEVVKLFEEGKDTEALALIESPNGPPPAQAKAFLAGRADLAGNAEEADRLINEAIHEVKRLSDNIKELMRGAISGVEDLCGAQKELSRLVDNLQA